MTKEELKPIDVSKYTVTENGNVIKDKLKQEAEESFEQYKVTDEDYVVSPYSDDMGEKMLMYNDEYYAEETYLRLYTEGYLASVEPREKRIAELEAQIEKMKCCFNCKHSRTVYEHCKTDKHEKWEIKEK